MQPIWILPKIWPHGVAVTTVMAGGDGDGVRLQVQHVTVCPPVGVFHVLLGQVLAVTPFAERPLVYSGVKVAALCSLVVTWTPPRLLAGWVGGQLGVAATLEVVAHMRCRVAARTIAGNSTPLTAMRCQRRGGKTQRMAGAAGGQ